MKFVVSGGINTLATYIIYLLLLMIFNYSVAYTLSYLSGILISFYLNSIFVFKEKVTLKKFLRFPIVYAVQYLVNMFMIYVLVEELHVTAQIVPLIVIVITIPITYILSKVIIKGRK